MFSISKNILSRNVHNFKMRFPKSFEISKEIELLKNCWIVRHYSPFKYFFTIFNKCPKIFRKCSNLTLPSILKHRDYYLLTCNQQLDLLAMHLQMVKVSSLTPCQCFFVIFCIAPLHAIGPAQSKLFMCVASLFDAKCVKQGSSPHVPLIVIALIEIGLTWAIVALHTRTHQLKAHLCSRKKLNSLQHKLGI